MADQGPPRNLEGLLRMSIAAGDGDPTASPESAFTEMDEERKQFLQAALSSLAENSELEQMKKCVKVLSQPSSDDDSDKQQEEKEGALESLVMLVDIIDNANDLQKIGGFPVVAQYLNSKDSELKWRAADVVAAVSQNNPYSQSALTQMGVVPILIKLLDGDPSEQVRIKALYALSCLTRDFQPAEQVFMDHDGLSVLMRAMHSNVKKLKLKAVFMLRHFLFTNEAHKDTLVAMGMVEQLASLLHSSDMNFKEYIVSALLLLATDNPEAIAECSRPELGIHQDVESLLKVLKKPDGDHKDVFEDQIAFCEDFMKLCFPDKSESNGNEEDR